MMERDEGKRTKELEEKKEVEDDKYDRRKERRWKGLKRMTEWTNGIFLHLLSATTSG